MLRWSREKTGRYLAAGEKFSYIAERRHSKRSDMGWTLVLFDADGHSSEQGPYRTLGQAQWFAKKNEELVAAGKMPCRHGLSVVWNWAGRVWVHEASGTNCDRPVGNV